MGSPSIVTISKKSRLAMLRHLSSLPKRSTMTRSARPASLSAAASTEPIKPPPPVMTSISDAGLGWRRPHPADDAGSRVALDQVDQRHPSARRLDLLAPDD